MRLASSTVGTGEKRTIVLHGVLGSGRNLHSFARRLTQADPTRSFELVDLTGHGQSPPLPAGATMASIARDVLDTAQAVGAAEPFDIIGHSLGGRIALAAAGEAPQRVRSVTMLDISPGPLDSQATGSRQVLDVLLKAPALTASREEMRAHLQATGLSPGLAEWLLTNVRPQDGGFGWRIDAGAIDEAFERLNQTDLWPVVEAGAHPITCIRGGRSRYVTDADVERLQASGARVFTLEGAGHYLHVDALDELVSIVAG